METIESQTTAGLSSTIIHYVWRAAARKWGKSSPRNG